MPNPWDADPVVSKGNPWDNDPVVGKPELGRVITDERGRALGIPQMPVGVELDPSTTEGKVNLGMGLAAGGIGAWNAISTLPAGAQMLLKSILKFEAVRRGTKGGLKAVGAPPEVADAAGEVAGLATGATSAAAALRGWQAARAVAAAAPAVTAAATGPVAVAAPEVAAAAPKAASTAESMAEEIAAKIVRLRDAHGMSPGQIAQSIKELYGLSPSSASAVTKMVLQPAVQAAAPAAAPGVSSIMSFAKQAAQGAKLGQKIWMELDASGAPIRVLTSDQAAAAARAGRATTWVKNLWQ